MPNVHKVVSLSTAKIGKKKRLNRARQEAELKIDREELEAGAPGWLDETAAEEFNRVVREAGKLPLFDNLDRSILAIYAQNYSTYIKANQQLKKYGLVIKGKDKMPIPSPYCTVADKAANKVLQCSSKLGLAVTDRLRLIVPTRDEMPEVNKYLKFLPNGR